MTTTKPPTEAWLQWYGENLDGLAPEPSHAPAEGSVTWHHERIHDSDVGPYVLAVGMRERAEAAERELRDLRDEVEHLKRVIGLRQKALGDARKERDEERRQRIHEAELAREAIGLLRALVDAFDEGTWERADEE